MEIIKDKMASIPTVEIVGPDSDRRVINASDYDASKHVLWSDRGTGGSTVKKPKALKRKYGSE